MLMGQQTGPSLRAPAAVNDCNRAVDHHTGSFMRSSQVTISPIRPRLERLLSVLFACALMLAMTVVATAAPFDELLNSLDPTGDVNDFAGVLKPQERTALEERCQQLRARTGSQLAVVVLKSLDGGDVDDFTNKLFARWNVGQKGKDNGVMLLISLGDRKAKIETGYGIEPVLTDSLAGRILRNDLFPKMREEQYYAGISAAVERIIGIIDRNEPVAALEPDSDEGVPDGDGGGFGPLVIVFLIGMMFVAAGAVSFGGLLQRGNVLAAFWELRYLAIALVVTRVIQSPWFVTGLVLIGAFIAALVGFLMSWAPTVGTGHSRRGSWWDSDGGRWSGGGFGGGAGGFSGGGSWGGFGGGRSGGGGASGGW
jgi:uncharacterized protein